MTAGLAPVASDSPETMAKGFRAWRAGSGPDVAGLFHRGLAGIFLLAWISLGTQVRLLIGGRGLLPLHEFIDAARDQGVLSILNFPSLLVFCPGDGPLLLGTLLGAALALLGLFGVRPRLCALLQAALYLAYATACRSFLGFQWDNLLIETALLAAFLPARRPSPVAHFLFRALLFKLYFESGIAKAQSPLHDWQDGSAMTFYFETAPLPTALAWYAHHLPAWWHHLESRATLLLELGVPCAAFGPRRARLGAAAALTLFQIANMATANYGFFCPLSALLHLFLLDDGDIRRGLAWLGRRVARPKRFIHRRVLSRPTAVRPLLSWLTAIRPRPRARDLAHPQGRPISGRRVRRTLTGLGVAAWIFVSLTEAWFHFGDPANNWEAAATSLVPVLELSQTFRLVNTYHLFAAITRQRIEPEVQIQVNGLWAAHDLRYKPGRPDRAPPFVAPHQPRVDFLLWFYGLSVQRRQPIYVTTLLSRLCEDPDAVSSLFASPLPRAPDAVRLVFWDYRFTSPAEKNIRGPWWSRREIQATAPIPCIR